MTNLTREETVWLQVYTELKKMGHIGAEHEASSAVIRFNNRFCTPTVEDKPAVNSVIGVYVTREMLAKAWDENKSYPCSSTSIAFGVMAKALGLSE